MNMRKVVTLAATAVLVLVAFSAVERISFFNGEPMLDAKPIKAENGVAETVDTLAAICKGERGENEVLDVVRDGNVSYARCGTFWPFVNTYVMSVETQH